MKTDLEIYREEIDAIDKVIAESFEKRMDIVLKVAEYKKKNNIQTFDPQREQKMKDKNQNYIKSEMLKSYYLKFLQSYVDISKEYQNDIRELAKK